MGAKLIQTNELVKLTLQKMASLRNGEVHQGREETNW